MGADGSEDWDYPAEPCSCHVSKNPVALFGNRRTGQASPGLSLVTHKRNNPYLQDQTSATAATPTRCSSCARKGQDPRRTALVLTQHKRDAPRL